MAHENINARREEVKAMLDEEVAHPDIKAILYKKYECHKSAINADIQYFKTEHLSETIHVSKAMRERIFERDGRVCQYCNDSNASSYIIEHIIPASQEGVAKEYNLTVACQKCNTLKKRKVWTPRNCGVVTKGHADWRKRILKSSVKDCRRARY